MKKLFFLFFLLPLVAVAGEVVVTGVTAQQRYPGNGPVDVTVAFQGSAEDLAVTECSFVATNSATRAEIPVAHVTRDGNDVGSGSTWIRKYIWDAKADVGAVKIDDVLVTVNVELPYVQLWTDGPYWATCNVGATKPEECGYYFWWGDTIGYKRNGESWDAVDGSKTGFSFDSGICPTYGKDNSQLQSEGYIDSTGNLVAAYDAATAHLGAQWRMPTDAEFAALIDNCTTTWTTRHGVAGRLVTGKGVYSSKSIFLPAAGYGFYSELYDIGMFDGCRSSTPNSDYSERACYLCFGSGYFNRSNFDLRYNGHSVRPVREFADPSVAIGGVATRLSLDFSIGTVSVTGVEARQRYPWNGLVDITVTIQGSADGMAETVWSFVATNSATNAEIPVTHIMRNGDDVGSGTVWSRKFIWDAKADVGAVKIDDVALSVEAFAGVQLWENGPYWAMCNVGAAKPEEYGYYFWWGDTVGYKRNANDNGWVSVKDSIGFLFSSGNCPTSGKSNFQLKSEGYIDSTGNLVAAYDAATAHLGAQWRMPTDAEFDALINNCTTTWITRNGVSGRLVTGKGVYSSKSIFLPAAGSGYDSSLDGLGSYSYCWSSTYSSRLDGSAWLLDSWSSSFYLNSYGGRSGGCSVRPVRGGFSK